MGHARGGGTGGGRASAGRLTSGECRYMVASGVLDRNAPAHPAAPPAEHHDFGPIQPLLDDPTVSEVMVNGPNLVYAERKGKLEKTDVKFKDNDHVREV